MYKNNLNLVINVNKSTSQHRCSCLIDLLYLQVVGKKDSVFTGVHRYVVELWDTYTANDINLAQELVWSGLVAPKEGSNLMVKSHFHSHWLHREIHFTLKSNCKESFIIYASFILYIIIYTLFELFSFYINRKCLQSKRNFF